MRCCDNCVPSAIVCSARRRIGSSTVAATAVRGTVDGLLLVGIGEAFLLGIAYAVCGVPHAVLFGVLTGIMSAIPFASPLVFIGAALWLLMQSATFAAIGLLAFGTLVVFVADHFARPVLIGGVDAAAVRLGAARHPGRRRDLRPAGTVSRAGAARGADHAVARARRTDLSRAG